jgi:hypothetical protein
MTTRCTLRKKLAHGDAQGDDQGCDTQRLVSQTMGRPFVAEGGFGLGRKPREVLAMWDSPPLPSPHKAVDKQQQQQRFGGVELASQSMVIRMWKLE